MTVREHHFDIGTACKVGIEAAVILYNIIYWVKKNEANNKNFFDGKYWMYNSVNAFKKLFPYLTEYKIYSSLKKLEDEGYITSGNFNPNPYDRTKWYAINPKIQDNSISQKPKMDLQKTSNVFPKNHKCITNNKTDKKPNNKTDNIDQNEILDDKDSQFELFWNKYGKKTGKKKAYSAFRRLSRKNRQLALENVDAYVKATPDIQYRKHPTTWLNGECWNDEIYIPTEKKENNVSKMTLYLKQQLEKKKKHLAPGPSGRTDG